MNSPRVSLRDVAHTFHVQQQARWQNPLSIYHSFSLMTLAQQSTKHLYVIGNGFDLWHGLPTSFKCFNEFAEDALAELESFYEINVGDEGPWCDFENKLGTFDWQSFYKAHDNTDVTSENFKTSEVYGLEDDLAEQADNHIEEIKERFREWIDGIDVSNVVRKIHFSEHDRFLTFNYTSTLQLAYGIDDGKIIHIHGRSENFDDLIFGHGETMEEEPELDENGDSNRTIFSDAESAAKRPFYTLQKPINEVISRNIEYFKSLADITDITVIGHSLNNIDLPYFKKLAESIPDAKWQVFYHDAKDEFHHSEQLLKSGIPKQNFRLCST